MVNIKEALVRFNPWWTGPFQTEIKNRTVFTLIQKFLPTRQIIALTGLRRVGKTSLMQKMIQNSLQNHESKRIVYFSFDEFQQADLHQLLDAYTDLTGHDLKEGNYELYLDEVQKLTNWENQVKTIYDQHPHIKIIVSGSESLFIRKKSRETLAGRMYEFKINPLTFHEYLEFKGLSLQPAALFHNERRAQFAQYMQTLGFPELLNTTDPQIIEKYVNESIVEKIIYRDLPTLISIQNIAALHALLKIIMEKPGQLIEINKIANELSITRQTASNYLSFLEHAFLVQPLYNYSTNGRKTARKLKKYYPAAIAPTLLFQMDDHTQSTVLEWIVVQQSGAEFFWRDAYKNEVDIVVASKNGRPPLPIEVEYGKIQTHGLLLFMKKFNASHGIILTNDSADSMHTIDGKTIRTVAAFDFLLEKPAD